MRSPSNSPSSTPTRFRPMRSINAGASRLTPFPVNADVDSGLQIVHNVWRICDLGRTPNPEVSTAIGNRRELTYDLKYPSPNEPSRARLRTRTSDNHRPDGRWGNDLAFRLVWQTAALHSEGLADGGQRCSNEGNEKT